MDMFRRLVLAVCPLLLVTACDKADDESAGAAGSAPTAAAAPSPDNRAGNYVPCKAFDDAFALLIDDTAHAATMELKYTYSRPGPAMKKITNVIEAYAAAVDQAKAVAQDPEFANVLGLEAQGARITIRLLSEPGSTGEQLHLIWDRYTLNTGQEPAKHCFKEWLQTYDPHEKVRVTFR